MKNRNLWVLYSEHLERGAKSKWSNLKWFCCSGSNILLLLSGNGESWNPHIINKFVRAHTLERQWKFSPYKMRSEIAQISTFFKLEHGGHCTHWLCHRPWYVRYTNKTICFNTSWVIITKQIYSTNLNINNFGASNLKFINPRKVILLSDHS